MRHAARWTHSARAAYAAYPLLMPHAQRSCTDRFTLSLPLINKSPSSRICSSCMRTISASFRISTWGLMASLLTSRFRCIGVRPTGIPFLSRSTEAGRVRSSQKRLGVSGDHAVWDMAEFFVVRRYRRHGIGTQAAAHQVWKRFPGAWEVRVMRSNATAAPFGKRAISSLTGTPVEPTLYENQGELWELFSF
jgi:hypothetical protein